jgi:hypothetical protein
MAHKTYVPGLILVAKLSHKYATRWQEKLAGNLTSDCNTALLNWITATATLLICLGTPVEGP